LIGTARYQSAEGDSEIDALVYKLYNLTPTKIATVESRDA